MSKVNVLQMPGFQRVYKKLHENQKSAVDNAVMKIIKNPLLGEQKKGDLRGIYVYKFNCVKQEFLLAYEFNPLTRILLVLGVHENFYRDVKKTFN